MDIKPQPDLRFYLPEPENREYKPVFDDLPAVLRADLETLLCSPIIKSRIAWGGFSPAFSICAHTENGQDFFIKGTHPEQTAHGAKMLDQEIHIYKTVPALKDFTPEFHGTVAYGGEDDWYLGVWDAIPGAHIICNWDTALFDSVCQILQRLYTTDTDGLTPVGDMQDTPFISDIVSGENSWAKFVGNIDRHHNFSALFTDPQAGQRWLEHNIDSLTRLSARPAENHHRALLHFDMRADNIVFDTEKQPWIIDWPNGCLGPVGYDVVPLCANIMADSGLPAWQLLDRFAIKSGLTLPDSDIDTILAQISGYFALQAYRPVPDKLPRLRWLQKSMLWSMLKWLEKRDITSSVPRFTS
jgi:hypothetical protein